MYKMKKWRVRFTRFELSTFYCTANHGKKFKEWKVSGDVLVNLTDQYFKDWNILNEK